MFTARGTWMPQIGQAASLLVHCRVYVFMVAGRGGL